MKRNALLIPLFAVWTLLAVGFASAGYDGAGIVSHIDTEFNGVNLDSGARLAGDVGGVVPIRVTFTAIDNVSDVRVEVSMDGFRDKIYAETSRFDIVAGKTYTKLLSLRLPTDADSLNEDYTLKVQLTNKGKNAYEDYEISMQRESYTLQIKSVDFSSQVSAGDVFPVSVVIKNNGFGRADDVYVIASIPSLGVVTRGYVGDLIPVDDCSIDCDKEDSVYRTVYLKIPENAKSGIYDLEVVVYNDDAEVVKNQKISVGTSESSVVLSSVKTRDMKAGETKTYDLILVNSGNKVKVFNVQSTSGDTLSVDVPSVVVVGAGSSEVVSIAVTADSKAAVGTYTFSVDVDGVQTVFGANVTEKNSSASMIALTVVLVIIFVVLLAVLVVLLTRKEKPIEEVETSYY